tara:strand:+ start:2590 stop:2736 length:147 start_codon:yes stop_codon:yes gene_type:complete
MQSVARHILDSDLRDFSFSHPPHPAAIMARAIEYKDHEKANRQIQVGI